MQQDLNITALNLDWEDNMKFHITEDDFKEAICFIANGRKSGAVLIHCAQVCSESFLLYFVQFSCHILFVARVRTSAWCYYCAIIYGLVFLWSQ